MPIASAYCPVRHSDVQMVTDLEGNVTQLVCADYEEATDTCRLKRRATQGGPLSQLLERISEGTLDERTVRCHLR